MDSSYGSSETFDKASTLIIFICYSWSFHIHSLTFVLLSCSLSVVPRYKKSTSQAAEFRRFHELQDSSHLFVHSLIQFPSFEMSKPLVRSSWTASQGIDELITKQLILYLARLSLKRDLGFSTRLPTILLHPYGCHCQVSL